MRPGPERSRTSPGVKSQAMGELISSCASPSREQAEDWGASDAPQVYRLIHGTLSDMLQRLAIAPSGG
jgi:hypothetical protein